MVTPSILTATFLPNWSGAYGHTATSLHVSAKPATLLRSLFQRRHSRLSALRVRRSRQPCHHSCALLATSWLRYPAVVVLWWRPAPCSSRQGQSSTGEMVCPRPAAHPPLARSTCSSHHRPVSDHSAKKGSPRRPQGQGRQKKRTRYHRRSKCRILPSPFC